MPDVQCSACPNPAVAQWQRRAADDPNATVPVYACAEHTITRDAAAQVHAADCTAPDPALLPYCGCKPEPPAAPEPIIAADTVTLDTGWVVAASQDVVPLLPLPLSEQPLEPGEPPLQPPIIE